jgi:hypothetical protein
LSCLKQANGIEAQEVRHSPSILDSEEGAKSPAHHFRLRTPQSLRRFNEPIQLIGVQVRHFAIQLPLVGLPYLARSLALPHAFILSEGGQYMVTIVDTLYAP